MGFVNTTCVCPNCLFQVRTFLHLQFSIPSPANVVPIQRDAHVKQDAMAIFTNKKPLHIDRCMLVKWPWHQGSYRHLSWVPYIGRKTPLKRHGSWPLGADCLTFQLLRYQLPRSQKKIHINQCHQEGNLPQWKVPPKNWAPLVAWRSAAKKVNFSFSLL